MKSFARAEATRGAFRGVGKGHLKRGQAHLSSLSRTPDQDHRARLAALVDRLCPGSESLNSG